MKKLVLLLIGIGLIVGLYFYYINRYEFKGVFNPLEYDGNGLTNVSKLLEVQKKEPDTLNQTIYKMMDNPDQVVKFYNMLIMGIYNGEISTKDKEILIMLQRRLFDEEFKENNPDDLQVDKVISEAKELDKAGFAILGYESNPFMQFTDKTEYASIKTILYTNVKDPYAKIYREYLLQKDEDNKWRIKGFREIDEVIIVGE